MAMKTPVEKIGSMKPAASPMRTKLGPTIRRMAYEKSRRAYTGVARPDQFPSRSLHHRARMVLQHHGGDGGLLAHVDAVGCRVAQQQVVERGARDLERAAVGVVERAVEAEGSRQLAVAGDELRAELWEEVAAQQLLGDAEAGEEVVVVGKERLADLKTGEALALEQHDGEAFARQQRGGRGAGGAAADDED